MPSITSTSILCYIDKNWHRQQNPYQKEHCRVQETWTREHLNKGKVRTSSLPRALAQLKECKRKRGRVFERDTNAQSAGHLHLNVSDLGLIFFFSGHLS